MIPIKNRSVYIYFTFLFLNLTQFLLADDIDLLNGKWNLKDRVVKDFDGEFSFDNYNEYIKLKSDLYKNSLLPEVFSYNENTILLLNSDKTGSVIKETLVNNLNATINWKTKKWYKVNELQIISNFNWDITNGVLIIKKFEVCHEYDYYIDETSDDVVLEVRPDDLNFIEAGIYKKDSNE